MCPEELAYHPDMKEDDPSTGLYCFITEQRVCGPDCMAYGEAPPGEDYIGQWGSCRILTSVHKGAKHLTILAQVGDLLAKKAQDDQRRNQPAPPTPRGPTT